MSTFSSYDQFQERLDQLGQFRMVPGLGRIGSALKDIGPAGAGYVAVQVVGTNGKGSTSTFLESLARAHGLVTGLYTSPHFVSVRERIKVNGSMLPKADWVEAANATAGMAEAFELTYFEWLTLLAVWLFRAKSIDLGVIEAGLGGMFDATTALDADLVVFTPVGMDHQRVLGDSLSRIARDKAGAMRPDRPVISAVQAPDAAEALYEVASVKRADLAIAGEHLQWLDDSIVRVKDESVFCGPVRLGMGGAHQRNNGLLALEAWILLAEQQGWKVDSALCAQGLEQAWIPGRLQRIPGKPEYILDGAHNHSGMTALERAIQSLDARPEVVVFSCLEDKDLQAMGRVLLSLHDGRILVPELGQKARSLPAEYLAWIIGDRAEAVDSVARVLEMVEDVDGTVLVCGSLFLLAEFFRLRPEWLEGG